MVVLDAIEIPLKQECSLSQGVASMKPVQVIACAQSIIVILHYSNAKLVCSYIFSITK